MTDYSATRTDDGVIHSSDYGNVSLGDYVVGAEPSQSARSIYDLFERAGFHTNLRENIHVPIWTKLIFNTVLNTIGGATGMTVGQTGSTEAGRRLLEGVLAESLAVAHANGVQVGEEKLREMLAGVFESIPEHKTSMTVDVEAGRPTEVETIGGAVVAAGREKGVQAPVLATLVDVVRARSL